MTVVKIPGSDSKCKSETESLNLMYRDFLLCNANSAALWWFDMFDGWFRSEGMMEAVSRMIEAAAMLGKIDTHSVADIAVFVEGESMYRARKSARLATVCLSDIRRTLAECGCAYDLYSICDLHRVDMKKYKLVAFVNQYDIPKERRCEIENRLRASGATALWLYAPDYATEGKCLVSRLSDTVGITVKKGRASHGGIVYGGKVSRYELAPPYFEVVDPEAEPLAYFEDGAVAAAFKGCDGYSSVYVATCNLPSELFRYIAERAGAFIYSRDERAYVYPNSTTVGAYNATDSTAEICLPTDGLYRDLIEGGIYECKNQRLTWKPKTIRAYLFMKEE